MYGSLQPIFDDANQFLLVTNIQGTQSGGVAQYQVPLGTSDGSATGELSVKVVITGGSLADITIGAVTQSGTWTVGLDKLNGTTIPGGKGAVTAGSPRITLADIGSGEYETVAASQTAQVLGATGATGDYVAGLLVIPATVDAGQVLLLDGATSITVFTGGTGSVSNLVPFFIPLGLYSVSGAWKVTTGAAVSVIGSGNFT